MTGSPLLGCMTFWNGAGNRSSAPGKQFGVLEQWRHPRRGQLHGRVHLDTTGCKHTVAPTRNCPAQFSAANMALTGFPLTNTLGTKTCLTYAFATQQPFGIPNWNLDTCIFVTSTISIFQHIIVSVIHSWEKRLLHPHLVSVRNSPKTDDRIWARNGPFYANSHMSWPDGLWWFQADVFSFLPYRPCVIDISSL